MDVLTYVPSSVNLLISGYMIEGWDTIQVKRNAPVYKQIRGIRGKNTRTRIKDSSTTLTITTPQTSLLNEVLSKVLESDAVNGTARLEIALREATGSSFFTTSTAYILAYPDLTYAAELGTVTWTLASDDSQFYIGGARSAAVGIVQNGISRLKDFVSKF